MIAPVTLYREVDALGGTPHDDYERGYNRAIRHVLKILAKRGFSEHADLGSDGDHHARFLQMAYAAVAKTEERS